MSHNSKFVYKPEDEKNKEKILAISNKAIDLAYDLFEYIHTCGNPEDYGKALGSYDSVRDCCNEDEHLDLDTSIAHKSAQGVCVLAWLLPVENSSEKIRTLFQKEYGVTYFCANNPELHDLGISMEGILTMFQSSQVSSKLLVESHAKKYEKLYLLLKRYQRLISELWSNIYLIMDMQKKITKYTRV
jgi:hypothetical protein